MGFEGLISIGHDLVRKRCMRWGWSHWVLSHSANDKEFVHADFIDIAFALVLPDVRSLVESSFYGKIGALLQFRRNGRQITVEDEAEPIRVLRRLVVATETIGLPKPGFRHGHGGG